MSVVHHRPPPQPVALLGQPKETQTANEGKVSAQQGCLLQNYRARKSRGPDADLETMAAAPGKAEVFSRTQGFSLEPRSPGVRQGIQLPRDTLPASKTQLLHCFPGQREAQSPQG